MIYLDTPSKKLEIVLAGAVATTQLQITSQFFDHIPQATATTRRGAPQVATSNDTTDVTIVSAPVLQGIVRNVHTIFVHNKDTAAATVTIKMDDGGTETIFIKQLLAVGESLTYEGQAGWVITSPGTAPFVDTTSIVKGSADSSKQMRFEVDGLSAATTRVLTVPNYDGTIATLAGSEALTNKTLSAAVLSGTTDLTGGQIAFPATQSASAGANTLDDYEEGTWTPSVGGSATYTTQSGTYTKIGRAVHIRCEVQINSIGSGSTSQITGAPFTAAATAEFTSNWSTSATAIAYLVSQLSSTTFTLASTTVAAINTGVNAIFQNSADVVFTGTYYV